MRYLLYLSLVILLINFYQIEGWKDSANFLGAFYTTVSLYATWQLYPLGLYLIDKPGERRLGIFTLLILLVIQVGLVWLIIRLESLR